MYAIRSYYEAVQKENNLHICNYAVSMEVTKDEEGNDLEVSFAHASHYTDNGNYINITDWAWKRADGKEKFSFDSDAERQWTEILKDLTRDDNDSGERIGKRVKVGKSNPVAGQMDLFGEIQPEFLDERNIYVITSYSIHYTKLYD